MLFPLGNPRDESLTSKVAAFHPQIPGCFCPRTDNIIELELLRSVEWMEAVECTDGAVIWFDLEEMGLHGWAEVVRVEPCPPIKAGPGRVVLATVTHYNSFLMDLRLAGVAEPLHLTDRHRLFSATRQDWIPASELRAGEDLATRSGTARIQSVSAAPGANHLATIGNRIASHPFASVPKSAESTRRAPRSNPLPVKS